MRSFTFMRTALSGLTAASALTSPPARGQEVIDNEVVSVPGTHASPWAVGSTLTVGSSGEGTLDITSGGEVTNTQGRVGLDNGSSGTVTVTGPNASWTNSSDLHVGYGGTGALTISGGGAVVGSSLTYIGNLSGSSGTVTVTDSGSSLTSTRLYVGSSGTGALTISGGGAVVGSSLTYIGNLSGSSGTVTVTDAGSRWVNSSHLYVGNSGTGALTISDGGAVSNVGGYIGSTSGSSGTGTVTGVGSSWASSSGLYVGSRGTGALTISGGGAVSSAGGYIGNTSGSSGTVTVTDDGSSWASSSGLYVASSGTAALTISNGGAVSNTFARIAAASGSSGTATVTGAGSSWTSSNYLYVGHYGTGALTISGGGAVSNTQGYVGVVSGSSGTVTVTDAGSSWTSRGVLQIGMGDDGALSILNGANVTSSGGLVGLAQIATGTVTVDGAGSAWASSSHINVGGNGTGTLTVSGGGTVESTSGFIAAYAGSTGVATVTGPGSTWTNTNALHVGYQGTGTLSVVDSGRVAALGDGVTVAEISGSTGTLEVASGGLLETFALAAGDGAAQVTFNGGRLLALGDNMSFITGFTGTTLDIATDGLTLDTAGYTVATDQSGFSGAGALTKAGSGTLILAGDNSYAGGTTINEGTLQIGAGSTTGSIISDVVDNGALVFNRSDDLAFSGMISGTGTVTQAGTGILTLTGDSSGFGGAISAAAGTLMVDGSLGGTLAVASGAALGGIGTVGGTATVAAGGALIGLQGETLSFGSDLILADGAIVDVSLGAPGTAGLFNVAGNLTLDGQLEITDLGGFGPGLYRLFDYAGALTDNGLDISTVPAGSAASDLFVQTSVAQQVNLVNTSGVTLNYWDGDDTSLHNNGAVDGGNGTWNLANPNWTDSAGAFDAPWPDGSFAVFTGQAGTVTVDASLGMPAISGAQFATDGYRIEGGAITLTLPETILRVGFGSRSGASVTATIASELTGSGGLEKTDFGTLILTNANSYTGGTIVSGGTLQLGDGGTAGSILGDVVDNGTFAINRSDAFTFSGTILGTGGFRQAGAGTTILTADNSYTGGTTIAAGTLQLGSGGTTGSIVGDVVNNAALAFNRSDTLTLGGAISGTGSVTQAGTGTTILTGDSSYTGGTTIAAGTLQLGDGGTTGSIVGDVVNNAALVFNRLDTLTLDGAISGTGSLTQAGVGTTILTGDNRYTGGTTIGAGALQLGDGAGAGSVTGDVTNNGALIFRRSNLYSFAGTIGGTGSVVQAGTGTTVLTAANGYSGGTVLQGGMLSVASDASLGASSGGLTFDGGTLLNTGAFTSGRTVTITDGGGTFQTDADLILFGAATGNGALNKAGSGALILTAENSYSGGTIISSGTLQLGEGGTTGSILGDVVNNGIFAINRSDAFTFSSTISGTGSFRQAGIGTTILTADNSYTGGTTVGAGTLIVGTPASLDAALSGGGDTYIVAGTTLGGYGRVHGTVTNDGTIAIADAIPAFAGGAKGSFTINSGLVNNALVQIGGSGIGNRLIVSNYVGGAGSIIALNTQLDGDGSPSDLLVIDGGTASGRSALSIANVGGLGALTTGDGILVIDTINGGTEASAFSLASAAVAGPYEYSLYRGGTDTASENWYLRSTLDCTLDPMSVPCMTDEDNDDEAPDYRREDSLYASLPSLALLYGKDLLGTSHERAGEGGKPGMTPSDFWARMIGAERSRDGSELGIYGADGPNFDYKVAALQVGANYHRRQRADGGGDLVGAYLAIGQVTGEVDHYTNEPAGDVGTDVYSLGHYWTHIGSSGGYLDGVVQVTRYRSRASSHRGLPDLNSNGNGGAVSLEGGYPFPLQERWRLEPQGQVVYQRISFDSASDDAAQVTFADVESLAIRLGLRLVHDFASGGEAWLRADLWHDFRSDPVTRVSSEDGPVGFVSDLGGSRLAMTAGVSALLGETTIYVGGNIGYRPDESELDYRVSVGLRVRF